MKELKFGHEDVAVRNRGIDTHKRPFFRATSAALIAGLLYVGTPAAVLTMPNRARAEEVQLCGRGVEVVKLEKTVAQMDIETAPFRKGEFSAQESVGGEYITAVNVPNTVTFIVSTEKKKGIEWVVDLAFQKELDRTGTSGTRRIDISDFANYVRKVTKQKMERVYIILDMGTFEYEGKNTEYVTAHIYPLDKGGNFITRMKKGDLVYGVSYYAGDVFNSEELLVEPTGRRSVIAKQEAIIARK
ncbi:hypothetical protein H0O00_05710 [Candidatus Micrarchaeota archaeon]|nr:hypothetical protein [Candidatus Micrarchaeota archaeon]